MARGMKTKEVQIRVAGWAADSPKQIFLKIDGVNGPKTAAAVKRFQAANGLKADGRAEVKTVAALKKLGKAGGSTAHFSWDEFKSRGGSGFSGGNVGTPQVKENVRRLMWKLEALRQRLGNNSIHITSGFRSKAHNSTISGAAGKSQHTYGTAADFVVRDTKDTKVASMAKRCGFGGIKAYAATGHSHVDSRAENANNRKGFW